MEEKNASIKPKKQDAKAKGGHARAQALSPDSRQEIARKAALARWSEPKATHRGTLKIGEIEIPCFVLEDGRRVISGRGMTAAIGMKGRGQGTSRIVEHRIFQISENNELIRALENPIRFQGALGNKSGDGFEATVLQEVCEAILTVRDKGDLRTEQEKRYAKFADMLIRGFSKVGLIALVDEATGYQEVRDKLALHAILDKYLRKEFAAWAKTFPDEFYQEIFRLRKWVWRGMKVNRPQVVSFYTKDIVYSRLAPGILAELEVRNPINEKGYRKGKFFQLLTDDVGHPALAQHLYGVLGLMRISDDWEGFMRILNKAYPKKGNSIQPILLEES